MNVSWLIKASTGYRCTWGERRNRHASDTLDVGGRKIDVSRVSASHRPVDDTGRQDLHWATV
jgi:hypothetical protein